jgi:antitoxin YefM
MDRVVNDPAPVVVTRAKAESVVMASLSDWRAIEETAHLLSTPANAGRLRAAIDQLNSGGGVERALIGA